jgi:hypothetical protein
LVEERVSQEAVEKAKVKAFRKRALFARELLQSIFLVTKSDKTTLVRDMEKL